MPPGFLLPSMQAQPTPTRPPPAQRPRNAHAPHRRLHGRRRRAPPQPFLTHAGAEWEHGSRKGEALAAARRGEDSFNNAALCKRAPTIAYQAPRPRRSLRRRAARGLGGVKGWMDKTPAAPAWPHGALGGCDQKRTPTTRADDGVNRPSSVIGRCCSWSVPIRWHDALADEHPALANSLPLCLCPVLVVGID